MYVGRGIDPDVADDMVNEVMQNPDLALETHAREELGISVDRQSSPLAGRPPPFSSTFALGAFVSLLLVALGLRGRAAIMLVRSSSGAVAFRSSSACGAGAGSPSGRC